MKATALTRRKYTPRWGGNRDDDEPLVVVFGAPSRAWTSKFRARRMRSKAMLQIVAKATMSPEDLEQLDAWNEELEQLRDAFLLEHITGIENLDLGDEQADPVAWAMAQGGLVDELFNAILGEGNLTADAGKG